MTTVPVPNFWRSCIVGVLLLTALGKAGNCIGCRVAPLKAFGQSFQSLEEDGVRLNSVDRLILSLILAESKTQK
jgi:hypothetical protein